MLLSKGDKLGPYKVISPLGAGGMGEVYRARDSRLERNVALKILNREAAGSPDRRARFEREARAAAALNHPNIVGLYDIGEEGGAFYIVSELIEGEGLRERIRRGNIPVREIYKLAVQLADGMAAAHAAGITHRDLKPENIMLTNEGRVKILDFGLAQQAANATASDDSSTVTQLATQPGTVLGTVAYMSPEQARGLTADHRSDQFSFGSVLYEMVTGARPFVRDSNVQTMSAIVTDEPKALDARTPAPLRWTIARCLEKDAGARYDSTRDLYRDLRGQQEHLSDVLTATVAQPAAEAPKGWRRRFPRWALEVAAVLAASVAGAAFWAASGNRGVEKYRFAPMEVTWANPSPPIWSPDGKAFAYTAVVGGVQQLFLRYLSSPTPVQLTHGVDAADLFGWSPDNKRLVIEGQNPNGSRPARALFSVPVIGGEPEFMALRDSGDTSGISPDGKIEARLSYVRETRRNELMVASPVGSPLKKYSPAITFDSLLSRPQLLFAPDSRRIYLMIDQLVGRQLWSIPYPPGSGAPQQRLKGAFPPFETTPELSLFPDGNHAVVGIQTRHEEQFEHLWTMDLRSGARQPVTAGMASEGAPAVSPDGKRILFLETRGEFTLVSVSLANASVQKVTSSDLATGMPAWAMHQEKFAYVTSRNGPLEIWVRGEGWDRPIATSGDFPAGTTNWFMNPSLSPGADRVIYTRLESGGNTHAWISSVSGGSPVRLTNSTGAAEWGGSWSPDGNRFVFLQFENGQASLMIVKPSGDATPTLLCAKAGYQLPEWSPDGQWIAFEDMSGRGLGASIISADGQTVRNYGNLETSHMTFSKDSRLLYGIRSDHDHRYLFSLNLATKETKNIGDVGKDYTPASYLEPGIRFSISPDGKSILYTTMKWISTLWMIEGFDPPGWWGRLSGMF